MCKICIDLLFNKYSNRILNLLLQNGHTTIIIKVQNNVQFQVEMN